MKTTMLRGLASRPWRLVFFSLVILCCLAGVYQAALQFRDQRYVSSVAFRIVREAGATDRKSKVLALRDYLRQNISFHDAPSFDRPFLRDSAADTLQSGKGYCGEVTRSFICMAGALGIPAQRINLWGKSPHVVAEADLGDGNRVLVDSQNPPQIADLETLDQVIQRPEYDDYYTLNLRRLGISRVVSRLKLEMGPLTYWTENPHALKASLLFVMAIGLLSMSGLRRLVRVLLRKRGWVHTSNLRPQPIVVGRTTAANSGSLRLIEQPSDKSDKADTKEARASGGAS